MGFLGVFEGQIFLGSKNGQILLKNGIVKGVSMEPRDLKITPRWVRDPTVRMGYHMGP